MTQSKLLKQLSCINGVIELYPDQLVIRRKNSLARLFLPFPDASLTIPLYELESIRVYPTMLKVFIPQNGMITMFFRYRFHRAAQELRDTIEDLASRHHVLSELHEKLGHA